MIKVFSRMMPLKQADRVSHPHASETLGEMAEMMDTYLNMHNAFDTNDEGSFPRRDYTPHATHVDCRSQSSPSSHPAPPPPSNDEDGE
jgi:hypothetical protein